MVATNGVQLHLRDWGGPAAQPPIILIHGLASNARIWDLVAPVLVQSFPVVALNQRGHGGSDKPEGGYDFDTVATDLAGVVAALGWSKPLLVGHSWGANVALQLAAQQPALPGGIVLVDGGTGELAALMSLDEAVQRLAPPRLAGMPRAAFVERLRSGWMADLWSQQAEDAVMGNFAIDGEDRIAPHLTFERHLEIVRAIWGQRPSTLFGRITCPTLLIPAEMQPADEQARLFLERKREGIERAAAAIPHAQVMWAKDSVHDVPLHHPAWLAEQLADFARSMMAR